MKIKFTLFPCVNSSVSGPLQCGRRHDTCDSLGRDCRESRRSGKEGGRVEGQTSQVVRNQAQRAMRSSGLAS